MENNWKKKSIKDIKAIILIFLSVFLIIHGTIFLGYIFIVEPSLQAALDEHKEFQWRSENRLYIPMKADLDTLCMWADKYKVEKDEDSMILRIYDGIEGRSSYSLVLEDILNFKETEQYLYLVSKEAYVIIDKEKKCRIYLTIPEEKFARDTSDWPFGNDPGFISKKVNKELISYPPIEELSDDHIKIFESLKDSITTTIN